MMNSAIESGPDGASAGMMPSAGNASTTNQPTIPSPIVNA